MIVVEKPGNQWSYPRLLGSKNHVYLVAKTTSTW